MDSLAVQIPEAARIVGLSRTQFYRLFLNTGRLRTIPTGKRDRVIDRGELEAAYRAYIAEQRQEPAR